MSSERKNVFSMMCRLCMSPTDKVLNLYPLYPKHGFNVNPSASNIVDIIKRFTSIEVTPTDDLPQHICYDCIKVLKSMLQFQNKCKQIDGQLRKLKQNWNEVDNQREIKIEILDDSDADELESNDRNNFLFCDANTANREPDSIHRTVDWPNFSRWDSDDKIACHICGKLYEQKRLKYHINKHNGLKPFECEEPSCTSKFTSPYELKSHKRQCHTNNATEFSCEICSKGFTTKRSFHNHKKRHSDPKMPCMVCQKLFSDAYAVKKHMLVHSQERKFTCDLCKKSFQNNYTLRIHQRVHTQEKPYSCNCGATFAYKCLLKTHTEKGCKETNTS